MQAGGTSANTPSRILACSKGPTRSLVLKRDRRLPQKSSFRVKLQEATTHDPELRAPYHVASLQMETVPAWLLSMMPATVARVVSDPTRSLLTPIKRIGELSTGS